MFIPRWFIFLVVVLAIASAFAGTEKLVATQGGPADASQILSTWIYSVGFTSFRFGLSSALSVINFTLLLIASIAYLLVLRRTWGVKER